MTFVFIIWDEIFSVIGQFIAFGGGAIAISYFAFQFLGKKWLENIFDKNLERLRHDQALEIQRLRVEIDSLLSGAIKLQDMEFKTLPDAWIKLDEAFRDISRLTAPIKEIPNLNNMTKTQLSELLESSNFKNSEKDEINSSSDKNKSYDEISYWYDLASAHRSIFDLHTYVARNAIFFPPKLKLFFEEASKIVFDVMIKSKTSHKYKKEEMEINNWKSVQETLNPIRLKIEKEIYSRLQEHGKTKIKK
ncbi:MAG: hypothetical protein OEZ22_14790 [Spirochaetia bacterium]|nr:hypothetical protein [Spirochaetia bacterium]